MLAQYLHQICRAVLDVLAEAAGGEFLACDLMQIDRKEFSLQTVAAAHYPEGPLRRLILGCEERLAEHIAHSLARPGETAVDDARGGLLLLCKRLEERLGATGLDLASRQFLLHETDRFRVHCDGPRNFHLRVALAEGRLDLLMDLTPQDVGRAWFDDELGDRRSRAIVRGGEDVAVTDPATVERIVLHLSSSGTDAQVKVPRADGRFDLLPATFLGGGCERRPAAPVADLRASSRRDGRRRACRRRISLVFVLQDRLLEAVCPVLEQQPGTLDDDLALPMLVVGFPDAGDLRPAPQRDPHRADAADPRHPATPGDGRPRPPRHRGHRGGHQRDRRAAGAQRGHHPVRIQGRRPGGLPVEAAGVRRAGAGDRHRAPAEPVQRGPRAQHREPERRVRRRPRRHRGRSGPGPRLPAPVRAGDRRPAAWCSNPSRS